MSGCKAATINSITIVDHNYCTRLQYIVCKEYKHLQYFLLFTIHVIQQIVFSRAEGPYAVYNSGVGEDAPGP